MGSLGRGMCSARDRLAKHRVDEAGRAVEARGSAAGLPGDRCGRWQASQDQFQLAVLPTRCPEPRWRTARQRLVRRRAAWPRTTRLWTERTRLAGLLRYRAGRAEGPATTGRTGRPNGARQGVPISWPCGQLAKAHQAENLWTTRRADQEPAQTDQNRTRADREQAPPDWKQTPADPEPGRADPTQRWTDQQQTPAARKQAQADREQAPTHRQQARADQRQAPADQARTPADRTLTRADQEPRRAGPEQRPTDQRQTRADQR